MTTSRERRHKKRRIHWFYLPALVAIGWGNYLQYGFTSLGIGLVVGLLLIAWAVSPQNKRRQERRRQKHAPEWEKFENERRAWFLKNNNATGNATARELAGAPPLLSSLDTASVIHETPTLKFVAVRDLILDTKRGCWLKRLPTAASTEDAEHVVRVAQGENGLEVALTQDHIADVQLSGFNADACRQAGYYPVAKVTVV